LSSEINQPLKKGIEEIKACALVIGQTQVNCGMKQAVQDYVDQVGPRNAISKEKLENIFGFEYSNYQTFVTSISIQMKPLIHVLSLFLFK
jgi:hypothetical protein